MMPPAGYLVLALLAACLATAAYALGRRIPGGRARGAGFDAASERALEALGAGMIVVGRHGRVVGSNAEARILLGLAGSASETEASVASDSYRIQAALREMPALFNILVAGEGGAQLELGEGAGRRLIEARAFRLGGSAPGRGVVLLLNDITENAALLAELSALASQDSLTGVYNRRRFDELGARDFELSRRSGASIGVIMFDLDLFKRVNDERGHAVGDQVLKAVCLACREALRSTDVFARYGGEEFAVLLPDSGELDSVAVAERLRARIGDLALAIEGGSVAITASLGVYSGVPRQGEDIALYLRRADEAMYRSKALGRNKVNFWQPIIAGGS